MYIYIFEVVVFVYFVDTIWTQYLFDKCVKKSSTCLKQVAAQLNWILLVWTMNKKKKNSRVSKCIVNSPQKTSSTHRFYPLTYQYNCY